MDSQSIYNVTNVINTVLITIMMLGGFFVLRGSVGQATSDAQQSAITAQQSEIDTLRGRLDDLREENTRLNHVIQTICTALKGQGIAITIDGEMINIKNASGGLTATRIQEGDA
jgi:hypothetical protein